MPIEKCDRFKSVGTVVRQLLQLFTRYDIHATWATVGLLQYTNIAELKNDNRLKKINYSHPAYSPFPLTPKQYGNFDEDLLLGRNEIKHILATPFQELGSHTFSHFYSCEAGILMDDFDADCQQMAELADELQIEFQSIVFPRNQINTAALALLYKRGYTAYRGNQENRFWKNSNFASESVFKKAGRVIDAYLKNSTTKAYGASELPKSHGLLNVPANRFFRPVSTKNWLEKRKIKRIKQEMHAAAKNGTVYHLWWHPHNLTVHTEKAFGQLEELFAYYQVLRQEFDFESLNMAEIAEYVKS